MSKKKKFNQLNQKDNKLLNGNQKSSQSFDALNLLFRKVE